MATLCLKIPLSTQWWVKNHPASSQTIKYWQQSGSKPVFIDLRDQNSYDKVHLLDAINFPFGKGLTHYLKNNPDKKIILYCELGLKSASLRWLDVDSSFLKQALEENRLFYFPGGLHKLMALGDRSPAPIIINIPSIYANYLLKNPKFSEIKQSNDKQSPSFVLSEYEKIIAKQGIPIINSTIPSDAIAEQLRQLNVNYLYFTTTTKAETYPLNNFLLIIALLAAALFIIRRQELFRSIFTEPSTIYKWTNVLISMVVTIVVIQLGLFKLFIPFDLYLYTITTELPMNVSYLLSVYTFFGLIFLAHLVYPGKKRLNGLQLKLSNVFAPNQYIRLLTRPTWKQIFIVSIVVYGLYVLSYSLSTIFLLSIFLSVPLLVDLLLYNVLRFKNTPTHLLKLLGHCGYSCNPNGKTFIQLNTHNELALARINVTMGTTSAGLGLFSGRLLDDCNNDIQAKNLMTYCQMVRQLLFFFQQDIELHLDSKNTIISLQLYRNTTTPRVLSRHVLLKHYQILPGAINEKRFTSTLFQDIFANPTPLMLDILQRRWHKKGGCFKALHKLGLLIKYSDKTKEQFVAFSNQIYLDTTLEKAIFSANRWRAWIRKKIVDIAFHLGIDSILQDYYTLILPRTQLRLTKLTDDLHKNLSERQLKRRINWALTSLCKESAMWQCYSGLLHQHTFRELQIAATNASCDLSDLINYPRHLSHSLPEPTHYELSANTSLSSEIESEQQDNYLYYRSAFFKTETVRTYMRQLQLKEWQLISLLLEKLRKKLMLPISLVYLIMDDFILLPGRRDKLIELLDYRYEMWKIQNQWHFPASFSLQDLENPSFLIEKHDANSCKSHAIRVAGNQQIITGNAVVFHDNMVLESLPNGSILIADNLLPEHIIACQHINGVILKNGGYLSHTSIIAREKNIPMIAQFQISEIKDNDKLMIQSGNQVSILSNKVLEWEFLDGMATTTTVGNKAQRLILMSQKGFNLPTTIILKHSAIERIHTLAALQIAPDAPSQLGAEYYEELNQIVDLLAQKKSSIIVRSSTNVEDSTQYSYAGIFYSQPNINSTEELISAICAAGKNLTDRAKIIKQYSGETQLSLNLILQPYIEGQFGGVLFTESSTPGLMHVEIAPGGVEGVTEGNAVLTSLYIDERGQPIDVIGEKNCISNEEYRALYHIGRELEVLCGKPQDIEWIIADQQFYIIQSRDISDKAKSL